MIVNDDEDTNGWTSQYLSILVDLYSVSCTIGLRAHFVLFLVNSRSCMRLAGKKTNKRKKTHWTREREPFWLHLNPNARPYTREHTLSTRALTSHDTETHEGALHTLLLHISQARAQTNYVSLQCIWWVQKKEKKTLEGRLQKKKKTRSFRPPNPPNTSYVRRWGDMKFSGLGMENPYGA